MHLAGVRGLAQVDAIADQLIPNHDLQLQLGVAHQLPGAGGGRLGAGVPSGAQGWAATALPSAARRDRVHRGRGLRLRLEREVEAGGGRVLLPQPAHSLQDAAAVRGRQDLPMASRSGSPICLHTSRSS